MGMNEIHLGDIGTKFEITVMNSTVAVNIKTATTKSIIFQKPDESQIEKDAEFTTDGTNGKMKYLTIADDLDQVGMWKFQAHLVMPNGAWKSDISTFQVHANL